MKAKKKAKKKKSQIPQRQSSFKIKNRKIAETDTIHQTNIYMTDQ
jgi:hypothetical protein